MSSYPVTTPKRLMLAATLMALQWREEDTHKRTHTHTWGLQLTASGLENASQLSCERRGDALTALMKPMQIDYAAVFDLCAADCSGGAAGLGPAQRWPGLIPTTALKYAVTSCASSRLSLPHYVLEFANQTLVLDNNSTTLCGSIKKGLFWKKSHWKGGFCLEAVQFLQLQNTEKMLN